MISPATTSKDFIESDTKILLYDVHGRYDIYTPSLSLFSLSLIIISQLFSPCAPVLGHIIYKLIHMIISYDVYIKKDY